MPVPRKRMATIAGATAILALALAGCAESAPSGSGSDSTSASSPAVDGAAGLATATERVALYSDPASIEYPMPPEDSFDVGSKRIAIIACSLASECATQAAFMEEAVAAAGWTAPPVFDGQFDPTEQAKYIQQAVNEGYDGIAVVSIDLQAVSAAADAAIEAGIPIVCMSCDTDGYDDTDLVMDTGTSGYADGQLIAALATVEAQGEGTVAGFNDTAFPIVVKRMQGVADGIAELCPNCAYLSETVSASELAEPGPPSWKAFLDANPPGTVDVVVAPYGIQAIPFAKTQEQTGRTDPTILSMDANEELVNMVVTATPAFLRGSLMLPYEYSAWAGIDNLIRRIQGAETYDVSALPAAIMTQDNADQFLDGYSKTPFSVPELFAERWGR